METQFSTCKICSGPELKTVNQRLNLVQCGTCEFIFAKKIYSEEEIVEKYRELYDENSGLYDRHLVTEFKEIQEGTVKIGRNRSGMIDKYALANASNSILEIGSGIGLVGYYIKQSGHKGDYLGVELDTQAFEKSQQLGLNTVNADFSYMETLNRDFDVIMMWEVIEHLQDLKKFMKLAHDRLAPNGVLILSTPNYNKVKNYPDNPKELMFQNEPPIHLNFFTRRNITDLFKRFGFDPFVVRVKKRPYFKPKQRQFYKFLLKSLVGAYEGPTLYLVARKK